jgi:hypothetical protein
MATKTAATRTAADPALRVPPEEIFWKRYSPHGEAPLSLAGSFGLHLAIGGGLLLLGMFILTNFGNSRTSLPVEPVRLNLGGGGGKPSGTGDGKGVGSGMVEDVPEGKEDVPNPLGKEEILPTRPALNETEVAKIEEKYDAADIRPITTTESGKAFARLDERIRSKLADGLRPGKGEGGPGEGGGKDSGKGKGRGPGEGEGKAVLNIREKRMLRWHMGFTANTGPQYLAQLKDLGAILAFPVGGDQYKVVRDLKPGGKLLDEDVSSIQRIYWIDDKPSSVVDIVKALNAALAPPPRFIAFMPKELEDKLFEMEKNYVTRTLRVPFNEDKIDETHFRVVFKRGKFQPELVGVSMRR